MRANALSKLASITFFTLNKTVHVEVLSEPGYLEDKVYPGTSANTWMNPFISFLE